MRLFALSDVHVEYRVNRLWVELLPAATYRRDALILAGDVSEDLEMLTHILARLRETFACVFFVPGNHDLWLRRGDFAHAVEKFDAVLRVCAALDVTTEPTLLGADDPYRVWVIPLFSWYAQPEESTDSLYVQVAGDPGLDAWNDFRFVQWPAWEERMTPAAYFLARNEAAVGGTYAAPVISFSHFVPRRRVLYAACTPQPPPGPTARPPRFNFSRVAGSAGIDRQVRRLGARLHVYGHQHRNRNCTVDGVRYVSHCLGYPQERKAGLLGGVADGPLLLWDTRDGGEVG